MSKKEFINAILRGDKVEAMEIKNKMSNNGERFICNIIDT